MSHKYKLKYHFSIERGEFTKADLAVAGDVGGTDSLILFSLLYPEDGSFSLNFWTYDGRPEGQGTTKTGIPELPDSEVFKVWAMLTSRLARSETLSPEKKELCQTVFDVIRQGVTRRE